jgi:Arc/MetJ-type ribon-helix-helix transcriptional regulator
MKQKVSITIESETIDKIEDIVDSGLFRNKSHFLEFASNKLLKEYKEK